MGFSDKFIAKLWETDELKIFELRKGNNIFKTYISKIWFVSRVYKRSFRTQY